MKKIITLTLALLLVTAAGCASQQTAAPEETEMMTVKPEDHAVGMANPWAEYDTLADAEAAAGVAFPQPKWEFSYDTVIYRAMDGIVEVIYAQDDGQRLTLRKNNVLTITLEDGNTADASNLYIEDLRSLHDALTAVDPADNTIHQALSEQNDCGYAHV